MRRSMTFIALLIFSSALAQNFTVSADRNNIFYIGVDNPFSITFQDYRSSQLVVKASKGQVSTGYGHNFTYNGSDQKPGPVFIIIYDASTSKEIGRANFRLKYIPDPVAKVGPSAGGNINGVVLKNQQYIRADLENFDFDVMFAIDSFTLNILRTDTCFFKEVTNMGSKFGSAVTGALSVIKKNDIVIFKKIYARGPDGRSILLFPIVFTITD
jgi:hypothetical protein